MDIAALEARLAPQRLAIMGAFHPKGDAALPTGTQTLVLLGPAEPGFWDHLCQTPEWRDGTPDPIDRWSRRVITALAAEMQATPIFPFGGPPYAPFFTWALASGAAWASPVQLLVQAEAGLMVSYRGALAFPVRLDLPPPPVQPCTACHTPCTQACPVGALTDQGYDVPACHAFLATPDGQDCLTRGCAVRRACPISESYGRLEVQSAYHMRVFHPQTAKPRDPAA